MSYAFRIFKFTTKDFDGVEFADQRNNAPLYGVFEVFTKDGEIWGRRKNPEFIYDTYLADDNKDPINQLNELLDAIKSDINEYPILDDETFEYKEMTDEDYDQLEDGL